MKDTVYNLFVYVTNEVVGAVGIVPHELDGSDAENISPLQEYVPQDCRSAERLTLGRRFEWREFEGLMRLGRHLEIFESHLARLGAPTNPLVVLTPILDGAPQILAGTTLGPLNVEELRGTPLEQPGTM